MFIVQEYQGSALEENLLERGPLSEQEVRQILLPVVRVLRDIHRQGSIHRDIKTENCSIAQDGSVKIIGSASVAGSPSTGSAGSAAMFGAVSTVG